MANTVKDFASPNGPILLLSAKGLTTAGIAEANGIKDFSGNNNHGQAFGGVTVEKYGGYDCFGFPNNNSYIYLSDKISTIFTQGSAYTYSVSFIVTSKPTRSNGILIMWSYSMPANQIWLTSDYKINVVANADFSAYTASTVVELDKLYTVTVSANYASGVRHIYVNDVLVSTSTRTAGNITLNVTYMILGNHSGSTGYNLPGYIIDARIYPRALSAAEVKYLCNGFQPNLIMGQTIPSGVILDLSARGLTTAGIAQANGVVDRSGNGNHGQAYNGVAVVNDDEMGSCFSFDGVDDYILIDTVDLTNKTAVTFSFLFKPNSLSNQLILAKRITAKELNFSIWNSSKLYFSTWNSSNVGSEPFLQLTNDDVGKYKHVVGVLDNNNKKVSLYIDGVLVSEKANDGTGRFANNNPITIGSLDITTNNYRYNGLISNIRIYPRALTASEVRQLADASLKKVRGVNMGSNPIKHVYYGSNLIYAKTKDYLWLKTFTRSQLSQTTLSSPSRAAFISPEGNMFATDWGSKCVRIFDNTGTLVRSFTPLSGKIPYGINGDATYLYVTYWDSPKIYKYQYSGTDAPTLKSTWTTSHQYNNGTDVYNGYLYVACAYDNVIMKIDVSSGAVTEIVTGMTYSLNDLAIDKVNSRIITTQNGGMNNGSKGHLIVYDMSGTLLVDKEMNGTYASKMDSPQGVVVDADGYIYLGGAYTSTGSYNQGFMVMDKNLNILYDLTQSECPTFCYTFNYDSYHNRVVWVGTSSSYIYGIDL